MAVMWVIPAAAVFSGFYALWQALPLNTLFWPSLTIGVFLFWAATVSKPDSRLRNISGLLFVAAIAASLAALLSQNGFALIGVEVTLLISGLSLLAGWAFRSKPAVLLSAFSGLIYLASFYPELGLTTGLGDQLSQLGSGLIPWFILGQIILAQKLRSSIVLFAAIMAAYIWLGTQAREMPLSAFAGLGFAIASAHYWLGKAWAESAKFGADIHRIFAWVMALGATLYFQSMWLNAGTGQAKPYWPPSTVWWVFLGLSMLTLFVAALKRYKRSQISLIGIFIVCLAVASLPLAAVKPDFVFMAFDAVPGLYARPGLGLMLGAIVIAVGFIWLIGGLKRGHLTDMIFGAVTIGIEALVLLQPSRFDADLGVIFVVSLICALCIGGLIAGVSPDRPNSRGDYA